MCPGYPEPPPGNDRSKLVGVTYAQVEERCLHVLLEGLAGEVNSDRLTGAFREAWRREVEPAIETRDSRFRHLDPKKSIAYFETAVVSRTEVSDDGTINLEDGTPRTLE